MTANLVLVPQDKNNITDKNIVFDCKFLLVRSLRMSMHAVRGRKPREIHNHCLNPHTNIDALRHQFQNHKASKVRTREHKNTHSHTHTHTHTHTLTLSHTCRVISFNICNETQRKKMLHRIETSHCRQKKCATDKNTTKPRQEHASRDRRENHLAQNRKYPHAMSEVNVR